MVEMGVVLTISAIVLTGMLVAYTDGIRYWRSTSDKMTLYNEGTMALALMSKWIRNSNFVKIKSFSGLPNAKIELKYPHPSWSAEFYFVDQAGELKWNDQTQDRNKFNMKLLPAVSYRGTRPGDDPYLSVKDARFTSLDDIGWGSPQLVGYSLIKIELVLESAEGDTLYLSSVVSKRNK
jgi:hypothetical protein